MSKKRKSVRSAKAIEVTYPTSEDLRINGFSRLKEDVQARSNIEPERWKNLDVSRLPGQLFASDFHCSVQFHIRRRGQQFGSGIRLSRDFDLSEAKALKMLALLSQLED